MGTLATRIPGEWRYSTAGMEFTQKSYAITNLGRSNKLTVEWNDADGLPPKFK